ncbi:arf GTPase activator [Niveomyces insectorum RCEF 264]|uniref:ADP-ribosylation factor GTPase-activating protein n=1 Tax=Niveomyces insectorum RCEF 264 TaxID=1081102 RepID=A0A167U2U2_9HYPO|nr:arf GTPase activator [Niveomyces insectorum RCEF 264]
MGVVSSRPDEGGVLYLRDQNRLSISSLVITSSRRRTSINIAPNAFPATKLSASRSLGDNAPIEYVQDPESSPSAWPSFLLKLPNEDELTFTFTFVIRQTPLTAPAATTPSANLPGSGTTASTAATANATDAAAAADTQINGLTFVYASNEREVENLVTREFHADPNLHKNANVELVGDFSTGGSPSVTFDWSWKWKPPKNIEDKGGGWRTACNFVEYDQRAHRLNTLASFSFFVSNTAAYLSHPNSPNPPFLLTAPPPKIRIASAQSVDSRISSTIETSDEQPASPRVGYFESGNSVVAIVPPTAAPSTATNSAGAAATAAPAAAAAAAASSAEPVKVDVACPRPGDDVSVADDGPVFRATIKALEQKTGNMRTQMKKIIKKAEHAHSCMVDANDAVAAFIDALKETSSTNANAVQPAIDHYFDKIAREILGYERQNTSNLQRIVIDPLNKLYTWDIKQAEAKKRDFEEESKDYYAYVGRYLGQRHDSVKAKKLAESDTKYQTKRRNFELKRFDYSSFMQDLSGGRKEQEVLSHLTRYADNQAKSFLRTGKKVDVLLPQLEALSNEVQLADKEYQYQRREREEKRRLLETSNGAPNSTSSNTNTATNTATATATSSTTASTTYAESDSGSAAPINGGLPATAANPYQSASSDSEIGRADSTGSQLRAVGTSGSTAAAATGDLSRSPGSISGGILHHHHHHPAVGSPPQNSRFKGIRDLEERDPAQAAMMEKNGNQRKEGLLWALNRPGGHVDPRAALNKQGWHKFWIVLDQGKLSEYSNWKQKLDLHMDPIDLRMASVREARNAERRFCFEVITPQFKRVYQATSEEDMNSWISSINNALQSAVEGRGLREKPAPAMSPDTGPSGRDIGSMLAGKSTSLSHGHRGRDGGTGMGAAIGAGGLGGAVAQAISGNSSSSNNSSGIPTRRTTVGARPTAHRAPSTTYEENPDKLLQMLRDNDQGNCWCADCGSGAKVEWVSINLAIILCIECSGIHRSLGTHISKVRSLTLDITSFTPDIVELLLLVGNRVANMVWEARLDPAAKLAPQANREQRLRFITSKYVDRAFVAPISPTLSRYPTPDETLLAAIKKNEIQQVIYALALRANPNAADRSRGTHAVFLALAAADPASPSSPPPPPSPSMSPGSTGNAAGAAAADNKKPVAFPVAELLLQNGAYIPDSLPAFPLSRNARQFIEARRGRNGGGGVSSTSNTSGIGAGGGGGLNIVGGPRNGQAQENNAGVMMVGAHPASTPTYPSAAATATSTMERLAREKEARLQKRPRQQRQPLLAASAASASAVAVAVDSRQGGWRWCNALACAAAGNDDDSGDDHGEKNTVQPMPRVPPPHRVKRVHRAQPPPHWPVVVA